MRRGPGAMGLVAALATAGLVGAAWPAPRPEAAPPARHVVEIRGMAFVPVEVLARPGDTVVWINRDMVPHTATGVDSAWSSPPLPPGGSWSLVAGAPGDAPYACAYHPTMKGRVRVTPQGARTSLTAPPLSHRSTGAGSTATGSPAG